MTLLARAFYKKGGVILVEPLGRMVRLGSVGYFSNGQWVEVGTTHSMFRIALSAPISAVHPNSFDGKGGKGLKFETKIKGESSQLVPNVASAEARAEITFGSIGAFIMSVRNQTVRTAQALAKLMAAIRYAYRYRHRLPEGRRWEKKYAVVVGIASAESVTVLSAVSKHASAVVTGSGSVAAPTSPAELDASMKVSFSKESLDRLWRGPAVGYAIQAMRIKPSIFKKWDREDIVYVAGDKLGFLGAARARGVQRSRARHESPRGRPVSYIQWAKSARLTPANEAVELLATSGRAGKTATISTLFHAPRKPGKLRTQVRQGHPVKGPAAKRAPKY